MFTRLVGRLTEERTTGCFVLTIETIQARWTNTQTLSKCKDSSHLRTHDYC